MPVMQLSPEQAQQRQLSEMLRNKGYLCMEFLQGTCTRPNCPYMHITSGEERPVPEAVCHFFLQTVCLREKCKFFHGTQADLDVLRASGRTTYRPQDYMKVALAPAELQHANTNASKTTAPRQPPTYIASNPQQSTFMTPMFNVMPAANPASHPLQPSPYMTQMPQPMTSHQPTTLVYQMPQPTAIPSVMPMMYAAPSNMVMQQQPLYMSVPQSMPTSVPLVYLRQ